MITKDDIFLLTMKCEGGYTNDKKDPGGETALGGITIDFYKNNCSKVLKVKYNHTEFINLNKDKVLLFYNYIWTNNLCDKIDSLLVAGNCFDFMFNSDNGKKEIQTMINSLGYNIDVDNAFGNNTISTLNQLTLKIGELNVCKNILKARQNYLNRIVIRNNDLKKFLQGWINRIDIWEKFSNDNVQK